MKFSTLVMDLASAEEGCIPAKSAKDGSPSIRGMIRPSSAAKMEFENRKVTTVPSAQNDSHDFLIGSSLE